MTNKEQGMSICEGGFFFLNLQSEFFIYQNSLFDIHYIF